MDKVYIVEQGTNPSTDFFVLAELKKWSAEVVRIHLNDEPPSFIPYGTSVVFIRYINNQWRSWVDKNSSQLSNISFFMDDDLLDISVHRHLSLRYRWKLYYYAYRHQYWMQNKNVNFWVSNNWLANKYAHLNPIILPPYSPYTQQGNLKTVFYHGSASHHQEVEWLKPVIHHVLEQDKNLCFELIGNQKTRNLFNDTPRVHVLLPMNWESYQALISRPGRTIGLAPLLNTAFNDARSYTKFFDITQAGAAGIYADHAVYRPVVNHGVNGLMLPMDQKLWAESILLLSENTLLRQQLVTAATEPL
ncbi:hypothetical protein C7I36_00675 [Zobellella taiwanensis]|uniref:Glycosyl transferase family 1 domain-containing protein n=1 Tax=Zobellella taiwanensis TaxID=347535 RepID=A0A2P7RDU2_9GAMM|nr:glycosyltransferase family 1 protein [Zobellella taiwanensis]PSJ48369.1 hypothetical protein C7I36_00675 [Zobellella taiwanensis]